MIKHFTTFKNVDIDYTSQKPQLKGCCNCHVSVGRNISRSVSLRTSTDTKFYQISVKHGFLFVSVFLCDMTGRCYGDGISSLVSRLDNQQ